MKRFVRRPTVRSTDRTLANAVLWLALAVYTAVFVGLPDNPDAEIEFQTTRSLARGHGLSLGGTPEAERILEAAKGAESGAVGVVHGREGRPYAWFGPGQALVGVPFYWAGSAVALVFPGLEAAHAELTHYGESRSEYFAHLFVGWRNPLFGALTAMLVALVTRRLGVSRRFAFLAAVTYAFTTFAWPQARSTLSGVQATFFLFLAFHLMLVASERFARLEPPRGREMIGIGTALGLAVLTRVAVLPLAAVLFLVALIVLRRGVTRLGRARRGGESDWMGHGRAAFLQLALPWVLLLGLFAALNAWRFGDPFETGYGSFLAGGGFALRPRAIAGLFLSPGRGLAWLAPLILTVPVGVAALYASERTRLSLGVVLVLGFLGLCMAGTLSGWHGAWTYGPRYLLPVLPFAWILVAFAMETMDGPLRRMVWGGLAILGLLVQAPATLVDHMTHQDLAVQASRYAWPAAADNADVEAERFERIQWDWGFAAPWAHWRILRHRVAGLEEVFPVREIFRMESDLELRPSFGRDEGFRHLAWVDLHQRLHGSAWPGAVLASAMLLVGIAQAIRGLDTTAP